MPYIENNLKREAEAAAGAVLPRPGKESDMKASTNRLMLLAASVCAALALSAPAAAAGVATVTLGRLSQTYDGTAKTVTVTTDPEGLAVSVTYDGSAEAPTEAGNHAVRAEVVDDAWEGFAEGVLKISKGTQSIAFDAIRTQRPTDTVVLGATASSGLEVSYTVEGPAVLDGNVLSFTGEGTVRVVARQAGNGNWKAASSETRVFEVGEPVLPGISAPFALDTRSGTRVAGKVESIAYSTEWNHGGSVRVAVDGIVLAEVAAPASGEVVWNAAGAGGGLHTLTHESGGETLTAMFAVGREVATVTLSGLSQIYDGTPKPVTVETAPEGLPVAVTYDGSGVPPTDAGQYAVKALVDDGVRAGIAEGVLEIAKARQTIAFAEIGRQSVTNTVVLDATASSGLDVGYAVEGPAIAAGNVLTFTGPGMVRVVASQAGDRNWEAAADVERVFAVGMATVTLGGLAQVYDGTPKTVDVTTEPEGLTVAVTYDGSTEAPTEAGSHAVRAEVVDDVWVGSAEGVLEIAKRPQTIEFPEIGTRTVTDTVVLDATASSGLAVSYAVEGPAVAAGNVLTFTGAGMVRVVASQAGNANWAAAADVERVFGVGVATVTLGRLSQTYDGTAKTVTVTTEPEGLAVVVTYDGSAEAPTEAGNHAVRAEVVDDAWMGSVEGVLKISKGTQSIAFDAIRTQRPTDTVVLGATASSGLEVSYTVEGPAVLDGNVLSFTGEGTVRVVARQAGNGNWKAASAEMRVFEVSEPVLPGTSAPFALDTRNGTRVAEEVEAIAYSTEWFHGGSVRVAVDGNVLLEADAPAEGEVAWNVLESGGGLHTLTHVSGGETLTAVFRVECQEVLFDTSGGTCPVVSARFLNGKSYTHLPEAEREGYPFLGWFGAPVGGSRVLDGTPVTEETERTLYAHWGQTVRFDPNGGTCKKSSLTAVVGETYTKLATATRDGHSFLGWYDAQEGGKRVRIGDRVPDRSEQTLWARWEKLRQTVQFDANGGTCTKSTAQYFIGATYTGFKIPVREGWKFLGWYDAQEGGKRVRIGDAVSDRGERTLWAHWSRLPQTVRFDANGGTCTKTSVTYIIGETYAGFKIPVRGGWKFLGWYDSKDGGKRVRIGMTVTEAIERTLYAHWQKEAAALSITGFSRSSRSGGASRGTHAAGTEFMLRVETAAGVAYAVQWTPSLGGEWTVLEGWTADSDGETAVSVSPPSGEATGFFRVLEVAD